MLDVVERVCYEIDSDDRIVLAREGWDQFAIEGDAPELVQSSIIGRSLWEFVHGDMLESVYRQLLVAVRLGNPIILNFRCDSPDRRRFLELRISPTSNGGARFETLTKRVEERPADPISALTVECSECVIVSCSWCKKIRTGEREWQEVERAVETLQLFDLSPAPQVSHGMCENCFAEVTKEIKVQSAT